ncbi:MAG: type II secretion system protein GspL [Sphingomonadaceae bacterium]
MSGLRTILFLWPDDDGRALRFVDGRLVARGSSAVTHKDDEDDVIIVVPGEDVSIHWIDLPPLAPAQARGAARLIAAELSASPLSETHVAIGTANAHGRTPLVMISHAHMAALLAEAADAGFDPIALVPEPLLLPLVESRVARLERKDRVVLRGEELALTADVGLAALLTDANTVTVDESSFEEQLPGALATGAVNLRQGEYARRRAWRPDRATFRRAAVLIAAAAVLALATPLVLGARHHWAAAQVRQDGIDRVQAILPGRAVDDPNADLQAELVRLRGSGAGFERSVETLFAVMRAMPNVELAALSFTDGALLFSVNATTQTDIPALIAAIEASGFTVSAGPPQTGGGVSTHQLQMRPQ